MQQSDLYKFLTTPQQKHALAEYFKNKKEDVDYKGIIVGKDTITVFV